MHSRRTIVLLAIVLGACDAKKADEAAAPETHPVLSAVEPNAGPPGTKFKLHGARLIGTDGLTGTIRFGDVDTAPTFATDEVYYSQVPAGVTAATHEVIVTTSDGAAEAVTFSVTGPSPEELEARAWSECIPNYCTGDTERNAAATACNAKGATVQLTVAAKDLLWSSYLAFAHILVIDNASGEPTGVCAVSDAGGTATLRVPAATDFALRVVAVDGRPVNTFHQRFTANATRTYYGVENSSFDAVASNADRTPQPKTGVVFGVVYKPPHESYFTWDAYNYTQSTAWGVGVATTVATDPRSGTAIYTDGAGYWDATRTEINPTAGDFIIYDVTPGAFRLAYFEDGIRAPVAYDTYRAFADEVTLAFPVRAP